MKKISLLLGIGLLCVSLSSLAGEYLMNDTGETVYGLRVVFSDPVTLTGFGDIFITVTPVGESTEFIFSGGKLEAWEGHWFNWDSVSALLISSEWLGHDLLPSFDESSLVLPKTTTTRFPPLPQDTDAVELPALGFSSTLLSEYEADDRLQLRTIDGFSPGSNVPLEWWYSFSVEGDKHTFNTLTPPVETPEPSVRYVYPDDGNVGYVALQYREPIDLSSFEGLRIVASADHPVEIEVVVGTCDDAIPMEEDSPCGEGAARFTTLISVTLEPQVFILPFDQFEVHSYILQNHPTASRSPRFYGVFDMVFRPDDDFGTLKIHEVSAIAQVLVVGTEEPEINEYYFQHPAYVMQGVDDLDAIYALPLEGISELGTGYAATDPDSEELMWTVETSDPGIGAGFQDETLHIWGADVGWSGYGDVTLSVTDGDGGSDAIVIPITVFREDKTLITAEGKTEYFVPWDMQLDINRITSVEQHMATYGRPDPGLLDRSVSFSSWRAAQKLHDISLSGNWPAYDPGGLSQRAAWLRVDETYAELRRIGCDSVNFMRGYSVSSPESPYPVERLGDWWPGGPSLTEEEARYVINEAHLQGLRVTLSPHVAEAPGTYRYFEPPDVESWFLGYCPLIVENARLAQSTGVDILEIANNLTTDSFRWPVYERRFSHWNEWMGAVLAEVRSEYRGPVSHCASGLNVEQKVLHMEILEDVDYLNLNPGFAEVVDSANPSASDVASSIRSKLEDYVSQYAVAFRKPMIVYESVMNTFDGALRDWDGTGWAPPGAVYDPTEQMLWYEAWFSARRDFPSILSYGLFCWGFWPASGGVGDLGHSARMKPTELLIASEFGVASYAPPFTLDGSLTDWDDAVLSVEETHGATPGSALHIKTLRVASDDAYMYIALELSRPAEQHHILGIVLDTDNDQSADMPLGVFWVESIVSNPYRHWIATLSNAPMAYDELVAVIDIRSDRDWTTFELRVPWTYLPDGALVNLRVSTTDNVRRRELDRTPWIVVKR